MVITECCPLALIRCCLLRNRFRGNRCVTVLGMRVLFRHSFRSDLVCFPRRRARLARWEYAQRLDIRIANERKVAASTQLANAERSTIASDCRGHVSRPNNRARVPRAHHLRVNCRVGGIDDYPCRCFIGASTARVIKRIVVAVERARSHRLASVFRARRRRVVENNARCPLRDWETCVLWQGDDGASLDHNVLDTGDKLGAHHDTRVACHEGDVPAGTPPECCCVVVQLGKSPGNDDRLLVWSGRVSGHKNGEQGDGQRRHWHWVSGSRTFQGGSRVRPRCSRPFLAFRIP